MWLLDIEWKLLYVCDSFKAHVYVCVSFELLLNFDIWAFWALNFEKTQFHVKAPRLRLLRLLPLLRLLQSYDTESFDMGLHS